MTLSEVYILYMHVVVLVFTEKKTVKTKFKKKVAVLMEKKNTNTLPWCFLPSRFPHRQPREVTITQRWHHHTLYRVAAAAAATAATTKVVENEGRREEGGQEESSRTSGCESGGVFTKVAPSSLRQVFLQLLKKNKLKNNTKGNYYLRTGYCVPASCKHRVWKRC